MNLSKRSWRYLKYRAFGWTQGFLTFSQCIMIIILIGMFFLVLAIQKLEEPYATALFSSGPFPILFNKPIKEIVITTARVPRRVPKKQSCEGTLKHVKNKTHHSSMKSIIELVNTAANTTSSTTSTTRKSTKKDQKYLPRIKVIYTPKDFKISGKKALTKASSPKKSSDVPDIYRIQPQLQQGTALGKRVERDAAEKAKPKQQFDQWTRVNTNERKSKVLVYSAYWDDRFESPNVRVMVIMSTKKHPTLYCRFKMADSSHLDVTAAKKILNEHWRLKYASFVVSCPISKTYPAPSHITMSTDATFENGVTLKVHQNKNDTESPRGDIAVCVKPLHYNYDRATWMVEFIEFHRMLGVDFFYFYNHTVGPNVEAVLRNYMHLGLLAALPWHIGIKSQLEIRTEAIFSSLNDCLFRTMFLFKYVIMLDFDEYIVPRNHDTYDELLEYLEKDSKKIRGRPGSFVFRNTFFYLYWENDTTTFGVEPEKPPDYLPYLLTQYKTRRLSSSMKPGSRSKYIVIPERAVEVGNHVVWRHTSGSRSIHVTDTVGLLHHYRICEFGGFACLKKNSVVDPVATRFGPELLERVKLQCQATFLPDGKCPISSPLGSPW